MSLVRRSVAAVVVGAGLVAGTVTAGVSAQAAPAPAKPASHLAQARADWVKGAHVAAAVEGKYWQAAYRQLGHYGPQYRYQRQALRTLESIPLTDTTKHQRAEATRFTRSLNSFFHTPGLYGVKPAVSHRAQAKADWIKSNKVSAAEQGRYLEAAAKELAHYGTKYAVARKQLAQLDAIPLTSTTKKQRAEAVRLVRALNHFFGTHFSS